MESVWPRFLEYINPDNVNYRLIESYLSTLFYIWTRLVLLANFCKHNQNTKPRISINRHIHPVAFALTKDIHISLHWDRTPLDPYPPHTVCPPPDWISSKLNTKLVSCRDLSATLNQNIHVYRTRPIFRQNYFVKTKL